jgi:hypothetical protein
MSERVKFDAGYQYDITEAYNKLKDMYGNSPDKNITDRLDAIGKLVEAIAVDVKIKATVKQTLDVIYDDVMEYINQNNFKKGGDDHKYVEMQNDQPVDNRYTKNQNSSTMVNEPKQSGVLTIGDILKTAFNSYETTQVNTYEAIKHDNAIINENARNGKSIRPYIMGTLVRDLLKAVNANDTNDINRYVFSLIQWYLMHNETKGITLDAYDEMLAVMSKPLTRGNDILPNTSMSVIRPFVDILNSYLGHL